MEKTFLSYIDSSISIICVLILLCVIFGKWICTKNFILASMFHVWLLREVMLLWANWGSLVYSPSRQSIVARLCEITILILAIYLVKKYPVKATRSRFKGRNI